MALNHFHRIIRAATRKRIVIFATLSIILSVILLVTFLHKARLIDCLSAFYTAPTVEQEGMPNANLKKIPAEKRDILNGENQNRIGCQKSTIDSN